MCLRLWETVRGLQNGISVDNGTSDQNAGKNNEIKFLCEM